MYGQLSSVTANFALTTELALSLAETVHKCKLMFRGLTPSSVQSGVQTQSPALSCDKSITTYYGAFENPCLTEGNKRPTCPHDSLKGFVCLSFPFVCFAVDLPPVDLNYYIIPWRMAENSPPLKQVLSSRFADYFKPIRAITLSLEMPFQDKLLASLLHTGNSIATYIPVAIIFI